ncbi:PREDICTED: uncharacterized protein LOC105148332 [Acromyrmex echinatior]|uniref:uncharacterized protein LOC105148332 n=1 Tax=Acromyrmex echinatior TaxID=103372 RepID=UPI000580D252|nr:PREDICTED: uncharacterized protein LOC105148332 [Acromyrmex echinatior]
MEAAHQAIGFQLYQIKINRSVRLHRLHFENHRKKTITTFQLDENTDATTVATINQLGNIEQAGLSDSGQAIEFMTQDGQKVRVLTSYPIDPIQLASEYLTIV